MQTVANEAETAYQHHFILFALIMYIDEAE